MRNTMAQFKRDAASGRMSLELVEWYGGTEFPDRMRGVRNVSKTNTVEATLVNKDGRESSLRFGRASLMAYDGDTLTFYNPGWRELTDPEKKVLAAWDEESKKYEPQSYSLYWAGVKYFKECPFPWLYGRDRIDGKRYDMRKNLVEDNNVKGDAILKYKIYMS